MYAKDDEGPTLNGSRGVSIPQIPSCILPTQSQS